MKKLPAALAAAFLTLAAPFAIPALATSTRTVTVRDSSFQPGSVTVKAGTRVTWVWKGVLPHNVVVTSGPASFSSGRAKVKGTFSRTLRRRGTYRIICEIHPGMRLTVRVR